MRTIDINCDLGEGIGNDAEIMAYINSCNIACGGHYGDLQSIKDTIKLAQKYAVKVGAHPSFPDKENFGRKPMTLSESDLIDSLVYQIELFQQACAETDVVMHHVKLHGALYNIAAKDSGIAKIVLDAYKQACPGVLIYAPFKSELASLAHSEFKIYYEAFADRAYHSNLQLVSREREDAVITKPGEAWEQILNIVENGKVNTVEDEEIALKADTFCVHGDQPNALELLRFIHNQIERMFK